MKYCSVSALLALLSNLFLTAFVYAAQNPADGPNDGDIRNLKVGVHIDTIATDGYINFACGNDGGEPGKALTDWTEFQHCAAESSGLHEVAFQYSDSEQKWRGVNYELKGTRIAGHPVVLSLLIDSNGQIQGIRAVTLATNTSMKHKAHLLSLRVKGRYGRDGWSCTQKQPAAGETKVGGRYVNEHCEKQHKNRQIKVQTKLYRAPGQAGTEFTNSTRFEILASES